MALWSQCSDPVERLVVFAQEGGFGPRLEIGPLRGPDTWLIHVSDDAARLAQEGFTQGSTLGRARMNATWGAMKRAPGYNFAFEAADIRSLSRLWKFTMGGSQTEAVLFRAPGLAMHHYDDFSQVCFWGPSVAAPMLRLQALPVDQDPDDSQIDVLPHQLPWNVLDAEGRVLATGDDLFAAIAAGRELVEPAVAAAEEAMEEALCP